MVEWLIFGLVVGGIGAMAVLPIAAICVFQGAARERGLESRNAAQAQTIAMLNVRLAQVGRRAVEVIDRIDLTELEGRN